MNDIAVSVNTSGYELPTEPSTRFSFWEVVLFLESLLLVGVCLLVGYSQLVAGSSWIHVIGTFVNVALGGFFLMVFPSLFGALIASGNRTRRFQKRLWANHDYPWYVQTFPETVKAHGRVTCRHCKSPRLNVRHLLQQSYMREHFCGQCGKTLYFSPEK